jgi:hypothetical protein
MGRTSILLVIAFNITFLMMGSRLSSISSSAYDKYLSYIDIEQAAFATESFANIAISQARMDTAAVVDPTQQISFKNGIYTIAKNAFGTNQFRLTITGESATGVKDTTWITVGMASFSVYAMYSQSEEINGTPIYWITGDTCRGPLHTQDFLYVSGRPVFTGMVTTVKGVKKKNSSDDPQFPGGYKEGAGVSLILPSELKDVATLGRAATTSTGILTDYRGVDTYVQFLRTGQIVVRAADIGTNPSTVWGYTSSTTGTVSNGGPAVPKYQVFNSVADLTSTQVFLVEGATLHVKGKLDGRITLGAIDGKKTSGTAYATGSSKVFIDSSIVCKDEPPSNQHPDNVSDDMLGIIADNDIHISEGAEDNVSGPEGITIHASILSRTGGFGAEKYDTRDVGGTLHLIGGIQQKARDPVGTFSNGVINHGFQKDYDYDTRLVTQSPAGYPPVTNYLVQNYIDYTKIPDSFWGY